MNTSFSFIGVSQLMKPREQNIIWQQVVEGISILDTIGNQTLRNLNNAPVLNLTSRLNKEIVNDTIK